LLIAAPYILREKYFNVTGPVLAVLAWPTAAREAGVRKSDDWRIAMLDYPESVGTA
jgi:hypothetical protein